jgi:Putative phage tail protein
MATIILSTIGSIVAGPFGQAIGAIAGSYIDRAVIGGKKSVRRDGPRLAELAVQTASYGEPLPLVYGKCRIAGNVIWTSGLIERRTDTRSGSRKSGSATTTNYSYFASFAVALTGRTILRVERIWADGKLIRANALDGLSVGGQLRIYTGADNQPADALLEAALSAEYAPNNRGVAYAVLEELPLAEFANRIPNLTFEVVADEPAACTHGSVVSDLARRAGVRRVSTVNLSTVCSAVLLADVSAVRGTLDALSALMPVQVSATTDGLAFAALDAAQPLVIPAHEQAVSNTDARDRSTVLRKRADVAGLPGEIEVRHIDMTRDYQTGVQRARRRDTGARQQLDLPVVLDGSRAKQIAETVLARLWRERDQLVVRVPLTRLDIAAGDVVTVTGITTIWRVDTRVIEDGGLTLTLVALRTGDAQSSALADGGAPIGQTLEPHGATVAHILDVPPLETTAPTAGRLIVAGGGASPAWRMASLWQSTDGGSSYVQAAVVSSPSVIGAATSVLAGGPAHVWDLANTVDIELLSAQSDVLSRPGADVLAGANMALLGDELIQFAGVQFVSATHIRLSGLLRGRRGTERHRASHVAGERFVLLDPLPAGRDVLPLSQIGQPIKYKVLSPQQSLGDVSAQSLVFNASALRPLSPVQLVAVLQTNGDTTCSWTRRSRAGFDWIDGVDAPLAEDAELYQVSVIANGTVIRQTTTNTPGYVYPAAQRAADSVAGPLTLRVSQTSAQVGAGTQAEISL